MMASIAGDAEQIKDVLFVVGTGKPCYKVSDTDCVFPSKRRKQMSLKIAEHFCHLRRDEFAEFGVRIHRSVNIVKSDLADHALKACFDEIDRFLV